MFNPLQSHKQQNGSKTKYCLEPFCGLRKPYDNLVREITVRWNQIEAGTERMYAKLMKLGFLYSDGEIIIQQVPMDCLGQRHDRS